MVKYTRSQTTDLQVAEALRQCRKYLQNLEEFFSAIAHPVWCDWASPVATNLENICDNLTVAIDYLKSEQEGDK